MNPWRVLGIPEGTDDEKEIRRAYAAKVRAHPPDVDPGGFREVREAYEILRERMRPQEPEQEFIPPEPTLLGEREGRRGGKRALFRIAGPPRGPVRQAALWQSACSSPAGRSPTMPTLARDVMTTELITVTPATSTLEAFQIMDQHQIGCLPVVDDGKLVGIVTEHDFMNVAGMLLLEQLES